MTAYFFRNNLEAFIDIDIVKEFLWRDARRVAMNIARLSMLI